MRYLLIGILLLGGILVIGSVTFIMTGGILGEVVEVELEEECDEQSLRKARMTECLGNAATNSSIHIYLSACHNDSALDSEEIFVASASFIKPAHVSFEWKSFDTLAVRYAENINVFKQKIASEVIVPKVVIEYTSH